MFGFSFKKSKSDSGRVEVSDMKIEVTEIDVESAFEGAVKKVVKSDVENQILRFLLVKIYGKEIVRLTEEAQDYVDKLSPDQMKEKFPGVMFNRGEPTFGYMGLLEKLAEQLANEVVE